MQFVKVELIKLYKNRLRYGGDWYNVVVATINRRVGDFRVKMLRQSERFLAENRISKDDDNYKVADHKIQEAQTGEVKDVLVVIKKVIENDDTFTDWDKEVLRLMCEMCDAGKDLTDVNIMHYMGYDDGANSNTFYTNLRQFRQKINEVKETL